jgi:hypothetical protein
MRSLLKVGVLTCAATLVVVATSVAGTYDVASCGGSASSPGWVSSNTSPATLETAVVCPPDADAFSGIRVSDVLGVTDTANGSSAEWLLTAPPGIEITRWRYSRYLGKDGDNNWRVWTGTGEGVVLETCDIAAFDDRCTVGAPNDSAQVDFPGLSTSALEIVVRCVTVNPQCGNGFSLHQAWATVYTSTATLNDPQSPTLANPGGALWTNDGFHRGAETATFATSDNAGIKRTRVVVDGVPRQDASTNWPCDYTYTVPCQNQSASYAIDTGSIPDGTHTLAFSAVDAADNEKTVSRTITVDNTAPSAPTNLAVVGGEGWRDTTSFAVTWTNPAGQVAPIVAADYELCGPAGCTTSRVVGPDIQRIDDVRVPLAGDHTLVVWLEDAAGNVVAANRAGPVHLRSGKDPATSPPPSKPTDPTSPSVPRSQPRVKLTAARLAGAHLVVRGTLRKDATGTVRVTYRVHAHGRTLEHRAHVRARRGVFRVSIRLSRTARRASRGTLVVRYTGDSHYRAQSARRTIARTKH